jgi:hypothetical protein
MRQIMKARPEKSWQNKNPTGVTAPVGFLGFRRLFRRRFFQRLLHPPRVAVGGVFREVCNRLAVAVH